MKTKLLLFATLIIVAVTSVIRERKIEKIKVENKQKQIIIDSLQSELFSTEISLSRYESTIDRMEEEDSQTCEKFLNFYKDTE